ncbi:hypothetical protein DFQ26_007973, partial [Actinomortierella ambigua]
YDALWGLLLPITVSFRVCDIWRGYWVQRLLWDVNGSLGFTKPTVDQIRNAHNYLDDYRDELQIYDETTKFIDFLSSWTSPSTDLASRIVELMQGMSQHKFVNEADVDLARRWVADLRSVGYTFPNVTLYDAKAHQAAVMAHAESRLDHQTSRLVSNEALKQCQAEAATDAAMSKIQITTLSTKKDLSSTVFKDVLMVVNFNHPDYNAIEPFLSIYKTYFPNIKFYGPNVPEHLKDVVSPVIYDYGWASYRAIADAVEKYPQYKGYLYTNDDTLLNVFQLAEFDQDKVWKRVPDPVMDVYDLSKSQPDNWVQWARRESDAMWADPASFTAEQRARVRAYSHVDGAFNVRAFADAVYVPSRIAKEVAALLRIFMQHNIYLEHALGLALIAAEPTTNWVNWTEAYLWEGERLHWREQLVPGLDMLHPVKLTQDPTAKGYVIDWIESVKILPEGQ